MKSLTEQPSENEEEGFLGIHAFLSQSYCNGPGVRTVIWTQGCSLACPGCFNPETHAFGAGEKVAVEELFQRVTALGTSIQGVTVSGGEPLQQWRPVLSFLRLIRKETPLSILLFSGYSWQEIRRQSYADILRACVDVLVAGRYDQRRPSSGGLPGSTNQLIHLFSSRYTAEEVTATPPAEAIVTPDGEVLLSGTRPLRFNVIVGLSSHP